MRELCILFLSGLIANTAFSMDSDEMLDKSALDRSSRVSVPDMNSDWGGDDEDEGEGAGTKRKSPDRKKRRVKISPRKATPSSDNENDTNVESENEYPAVLKNTFRVPRGWRLPDPSPSVSRGSPSAGATDDDKEQSSSDTGADRSSSPSVRGDAEEDDSTYSKPHEDRSVYPEPIAPEKAIFTLRSFITEDNPEVLESARIYFEIVFASDEDIRKAHYSFKMLIKDLTGKSTKFRLTYFKQKIKKWPNIITKIK